VAKGKQPDQAQTVVSQAVAWPQGYAANWSVVPPTSGTWVNQYPNLQWQTTSSNASYCSAASALSSAR